MKNPTFHLEGIVKSKDEMEDFEGPLNLILMLLSKNKVEIRDIKISYILDQYLAYIAEIQELDLEIASEFVQMASHLMYIKTRTILAGEEQVEEMEFLMSSLEQLKCRDAYLAIKAVIPEFSAATDRGLLLYSAPGETIAKYGQYSWSHDKYDLLRTLAGIFSRGAKVPDEAAPFIVPKRIVYDVNTKNRQLRQLLGSRGAIRLGELYSMCQSRSELVATFISILDLCSAGSVVVALEDGVYTVEYQDSAGEGPESENFESFVV